MHQKWVVRARSFEKETTFSKCIHVCLRLQFLIFPCACDCRASRSMLQKESGSGKAEHRRLVLAYCKQTYWYFKEKDGVVTAYIYIVRWKRFQKLLAICGERSLEKFTIGLEPHGTHHLADQNHSDLSTLQWFWLARQLVLYGSIPDISRIFFQGNELLKRFKAGHPWGYFSHLWS